MSALSFQEALVNIEEIIVANNSESIHTAIMMCGIAGSGKTTMAKQLLSRKTCSQRLSIDEIVAERHGLCGIDFPIDQNSEYQDEANIELEGRFMHLLEQNRENIVLDLSFWSKQRRDATKVKLEMKGYAWVLVYLQAPSKEFLRRRIDGRREQGRDANSALDINDEILDMYWTGFEAPKGEGELVVELSS